MAFLNFRAGATRKEKPAVAAAGFPPRKGHVQPKQDEPNMQNKLFKLNVRDQDSTDTTVEQIRSFIARGRRETFSATVQMTPEAAEYLLACNPNNRVLNLTSVAEYADAMRRGEWMINGQNIIVSDTGELNDGQHRLAAVVEAGVSVWMTLFFGVSRASRQTLDVGRKRTLGDHLAMAGYANSNLLAAIVRLAWLYDNAVFSFSFSPSVEQAIEYITANPTVENFCGIGRRIGTEFGASGAQAAFAGFVCSRRSEVCASALLEQVASGVGIAAANEPAARVRERLLQHATDRVPMRKMELAAILIKAFNAKLYGRRLRQLSWCHNGDQAEAFPMVAG